MTDLTQLENRMGNDALLDDDQGLRPRQDPYAPREFDDDQWCDMMQATLTTDTTETPK